MPVRIPKKNGNKHEKKEDEQPGLALVVGNLLV